MSEILKVTTPLVNKNQIAPTRPSTDPTVPFNMIDTSKVAKLSDQKQLAGQNNTLMLNTDASLLLTNLLNDPDSSIQFLRSIYLLQEVVGMLPMTNDAMSEEIVALFNSLLVHPENIVEELLNQAAMSTSFQGELFDTLRQILADMKTLVNGNDTANLHGTGAPLIRELKSDIANFMRALNQTIVREDVLISLSSNLRYLSQEYGRSLALSTKLEQLALSLENLSGQLSESNVEESFIALKSQLFALVGEMEQSLLYSPKIAKNISMMQYNVSRFHLGDVAVEDALKQLLKYLAKEEDASKLEEMMRSYLGSVKEPSLPDSKVMHALTEIIRKEASGMRHLSSDKIEKIVQSLLTSPSNFTPLLHFVIPMDYHGLRSFAELWIDPNADDKNKQEESGGTIQLLMAMDVDVLGRFEVEAKITNQKLSLFVYCPNEVVSLFQPLKNDFQMMVYQSSFELEQITIAPLKQPRTLMEVFENLPKLRSGINVLV